ncbi:XshC-Cox1 family protein [Epidermidibacterium keratini]|uniref:XshC-Cox1 family protein n=1 Tax=Epidermidibacterium keratini TaxID=1891644 RepID=A0A7L4YMB7_9ACTN|nr:XdhC family protein [Epidermidibacterium keratini]QHC00202.1 XshC-Cox1 family protein [Epidermidibacterium keratini]
MREILDDLLPWWESGETVGMGTVVATFRSAPRPPGASMIVGPEGEAFGSVSGGCVEGTVYEEAQQVVAGESQSAMHRYGISDDDAFSVGLTCGGILDVYVEPVSKQTFPELGEIAKSIDEHEPVAVVTVVSGPEDRLGKRLVLWNDRVSGSLGLERLDAAVSEDALGMLAAGRTGIVHYGVDGERRGDDLTLFVASYAPPRRMLVFGAIDFAAAVARMGSFLGHKVTVCDARPVFATAKRFPDADEVVVDWPHRYLKAEVEAGRIDDRTIICVLTHDPKFDVPLLQEALPLNVAYIGAMGSRRTHDDRLERLREAGVPEDQLEKLSSPIGLDLGARTPEETAVSIAAEIIALQWGGDGARLSELDGRIHRDAER